MKFLCLEACIDSGNLKRLNRLNLPETHNYKRETVYDIDERQLLHLTSVGLFPEFFSYADDFARAWVELHNDELCDIVDARVLPYRQLTAEEAENDSLIAAGKKKGSYTLPHGVIEAERVKLVRKGKSSAELAADPKARGELVEQERVTLTRRAAPAPAPRAPKTKETTKPPRKVMSPENRLKASENLRKAREARKAKLAVAAGV